MTLAKGVGEGEGEFTSWFQATYDDRLYKKRKIGAE